jgi:hypothetical protein
VAVVINNFDVTAESEAPAESRGGASGGAGQALDPDDFVSRYGTLLRDFIRDEIERHLRNLAD